MTEIIVKTQAELDAALARDDIDYDTHKIIIDSPAGVWITIGDDHGQDVRASGSATVAAYDSATVEAYGSATVEASGSATVRALGSATVRASLHEATRRVLIEMDREAARRTGQLHKLVADFQANGNSRELGDPTAGAWLEAAQQVLDAIAGWTDTAANGPVAEPNSLHK